LLDAKIENANFANAVYSPGSEPSTKTTILPEDFNLSAHTLQSAAWQKWRPKPEHIKAGENFFCEPCGNIVEAIEDGPGVSCEVCGAIYDKLEYHVVLPDDI
jgi:hypothetical protein